MHTYIHTYISTYLHIYIYTHITDRERERSLTQWQWQCYTPASSKKAECSRTPASDSSEDDRLMLPKLRRDPSLPFRAMGANLV